MIKLGTGLRPQEEEKECVEWTISLLNFFGINSVNPTSFLSNGAYCIKTMDTTYSSRPPLEDAEDWYMDGSTFVRQGYAVPHRICGNKHQPKRLKSSPW